MDVNAKVDCLKVESGEWNEVLIRESFLKEDTDAILSLPPSNGASVDSLMWHYHCLGSYSVRSRYRLASASVVRPSCSGLSGFES